MVATTASLLASVTTADAAPGELDTTFGSSPGYTAIDFGGSDQATDLLIDSHDRVVLVGSHIDPTTNIGSMALTRLTAAGIPDPSFGGDGLVIAGEQYASNLKSVAIDSTGRIVVSGVTKSDPTSGGYLTIARFTDSGVPDPTFGGDGIIVRSDPPSEPRVAVQADDKIVVLDNGFLLRFNIDGTLDTSFGTGGKAPLVGFNNGQRLEIGPDGKYYVSGNFSVSGPGQIAISRYLPDGTLDPSFGQPVGTGRMALSAYAQPAGAFSMTFQADGKVLVGGYVTTTVFNIDLAVVRFDQAGNLDSSFDGDGMVTANFGVGDFADGILQQVDGKIVAGGTIATAFTNSADIGLARFNTNGSPDLTFGTNGKTLVSLGPNFEFSIGLARQSTGRIIWGGTQSTSSGRIGANFLAVGFQWSTDTTPPNVTPAVDRPAINGWYNAPVTISWVVDDPTATVPAAVTVTTEGTAQTITSGPSCDPAGNCATGTAVVSLDMTAPLISPSITPPTTTGWYVTAPTVGFDCSDTTSGIATCTAPVTLDDGANQTISGSATDNAGNTATASATGINVDQVPPGIVWSAGPAPGTTYIFGNVPPAPTCTATDFLSGPDTCSISGYSTAVGPHTLTATAADIAGNQITENRTYTVTSWTLNGFYQPVDNGNIYNTVKSGSTVPLKWEIFAGPAELTDTSATSLSVAPVACGTYPEDAVEETITNTGNTTLRYDTTTGQFIYNWSTPTYSAGKCFKVTMKTTDGSNLTAYFKLK